jgi:hypothetical protein
MGKRVHPVRIHCTGGVYVWDSDQETPNVQVATLEYEDGALLEIELSNLYTHPTGGIRGTGNFFYTTKGYMTSGNAFDTFFGEFVPRQPDVDSAGVWQRPSNVSFPQRNYSAGAVMKDLAGGMETASQFENFIDCVRSRCWQDLHCDIEEGHMSTSLCHLANISYRTRRKLEFNPYSEKFVDDEDADSFLTRTYRPPYVVPDEV